MTALHWFVQIGTPFVGRFSIPLSAGSFGGIRKCFGFGEGIYNNPKGKVYPGRGKKKRKDFFLL